MSKKVTATHNSVEVESHYLVMGSDGQVYNASARKGDCLVDDEGPMGDIVLNKKGVAVVKKAAAILKEIEALKNTLENLGTDNCTDFDGGLQFEDDDGDPCVRVGCTCVYPNDLPAIMKSLHI